MTGTKHRAASLQQQSYLSISLTVADVLHASNILTFPVNLTRI